MRLPIGFRESIPTPIVEGIDRMGRILDDDLAQLADFDIRAVWRFRPSPVVDKVVLELTTRNEHGQSKTLTGEYSVELFSEAEKRIRSAFTDQILALTKVLSQWIRDDLRAQRARMAAYEPLAVD